MEKVSIWRILAYGPDYTTDLHVLNIPQSYTHNVEHTVT